MELFVGKTGGKINLFAAVGPAAFILAFTNSSLPISQKTSGYKTENNIHSNLSCEANERIDRIVLLVRVQGDCGLTRHYFSQTGDVSYQLAERIRLNRLSSLCTID